MTEIEAVWLATLQSVADRAAHEVKDALNGVALNVEVVRSRSATGEVAAAAVAPFAAAAAEQLETLARRLESLLFLTRPARAPVDVTLTLKHLAELLVPAARADGGELVVEGLDHSAPTRAGGTATRLALASGLLAISRKGASGRCRLEQGSETVVRFSHESAAAGGLDTAAEAALAGQSIRSERSGTDLLLVFPGYS